MSDERRCFVVGDRVRVSTKCFDERLRGAAGVVCSKLPSSVNYFDDRICWIEFEPWIRQIDDDPIEAAEVDMADLDPA